MLKNTKINLSSTQYWSIKLDIHPFYNTLLGRPWIHMARVVAFSLHQCLKYTMKRMLINVKDEKTVFMIKNVVVLFIEVEDCRDKNIYSFKIMNAKWVSKGAMLRKLKVFETVKMAANCFLKHGVSFWYNPEIRMPKWVNLMKLNAQTRDLISSISLRKMTISGSSVTK